MSYTLIQSPSEKRLISHWIWKCWNCKRLVVTCDSREPTQKCGSKKCQSI